MTGRQTMSSPRRTTERKKERKRAVQVLCDSVYRRDEENKKNMTSMYTNTHLTARRRKKTGKDDGTLSVMIM